MVGSQKQISKNAIMLYFRMGVITCVTLYTSRVVLKTLGIEDYGIYSVVAGIAVLFAFFSNALLSSTQRFITFEIGKGQEDKIKEVFTSSINCHIIIALLILVLSEIFGLYFVNASLDIPHHKLHDANIVFQFSLLSCVLGVLNAPYTACVVAYEKMSYFAWISIFDSVAKLSVVFLLSCFGTDKLVTYSFLLLLCSCLRFLLDRCYCYFKFPLCRYLWKFDRAMFSSMMTFSLWTLFKMGAIIGISQGNNIFVNIFGGPVASAAMGIANQVNGTVYSFVTNVQNAFNPQITKRFADNDYGQFRNLVIQSSRYSSYMIILLAVPFLFNVDFLLGLWLHDVPEGTNVLCCFCVCSVCLDAFVGPLNTAIMAEGDIRKYQVVSSVILAMAVLLAYGLLSCGLSFKYILVAKIISQAVCLMYSLLYMERMTGGILRPFLKEVLLKSFLIFMIGSILPLACHFFDASDGMLHFVLSVMSALCSVSFAVWAVGLTKQEKKYIYSKVLRTKNETH